MTEDEQQFGTDVWIYCKSHVNPHTTGWCTVPVGGKIRLDATTRLEAENECREKGLPLFNYNNQY